MKLTIIGGGYVGLVSAVCFSDFGNYVTCIEHDAKKYDALSKGDIPFYEPDLAQMFTKNVDKGHLTLSDGMDVSIFSSDVIFLAVGTPMSDSGEADLSYLFDAVDTICELGQRHEFDSSIIITTKSTVPVGTGRRIQEKLEDVHLSEFITVASNPEFLREGSAVHDFFHPDRVVIGCNDADTFSFFERLYSPICRNSRPLVKVNLETAELTKYAANTFLATKISFMNEMARICDHVGADISDVARLMGLDGRIGKYFLNPSPGYGGSCFPKDTYALNHFAQENNLNVKVVKAGIDANNDQIQYCYNQCKNMIGRLDESVTIAILGCSFKPNTDDIRDSSSIKMIQLLLDTGCNVQVTDPKALANVQQVFGDRIRYFDTPYEAVTDATAVLLMTEWHDYRHLDLERIHSVMANDFFLDFRLIYTESELKEIGFKSYILGKCNPVANLMTTLK